MNSTEILEKIVEVFNSGDVSNVESLFSLNYLDHQKPDNITVNGPEEFKQIVSLARKSLPKLEVSIKDMIVEDTKIAARLHWHSVDASGKITHRQTLDILHLERGKVLEHWGAEI